MTKNVIKQNVFKLFYFNIKWILFLVKQNSSWIISLGL